MVRLFGRNNGGRKNQQQRNGVPSNNSGSSSSDNNINNSQNGTNKRRLSPTVASVHYNHDGTISSSSTTIPRSGNRNSIQQQQQPAQLLSSPMYKYALDEYAQAVAPGTSNDDGKMFADDSNTSSSHKLRSTSNIGLARSPSSGMESQSPSMMHSVQRHIDTLGQVETVDDDDNDNEQLDYSENDVERANVPSREQHRQNHDMSIQQQQQQPQQAIDLQHPQYRMLSSTASSLSEAALSRTHTGGTRYTPHSIASDPSESTTTQRYDTGSNGDHNAKGSYRNFRSIFEKDRLDASYEEVYGPAYITGGTIKYIYPSGYQSMRPRSCPWKLSIVVCLLFTWLSIFIVGHCSDQADESATAAAAMSAEGIITDDALVIEMRWCGSRLLYMMWATSMIVTGLSAAYCGVIGYIKVRDFAVANSRSQPPGVFTDNIKSDYYVRIRDHNPEHEEFPGSISNSNMNVLRRNSHTMTTPSEGGSSNSMYHFQPTIYQSDGTPQFWGSYIYRPTQAAVAVTSR